MTAALIGLIGVIAGALLAGVANYWVESRRRRATAYAAGTLIVTQLTTVERRMTSASTKKQRWKGALPLDFWAEHANALAYDVRPRIFENVAGAYQLIDSWNTDTSADIDWAELDKDRAKLSGVRDSLQGELRRLHTDRPKRAIARQLGLLSIAVAVALLLYGIIAGLAPRPDRE